MSTDAQQRVLDLLQGMSRHGLESAKELIWSELNYDRVVLRDTAGTPGTRASFAAVTA